jgi:hypothetical protein
MSWDTALTCAAKVVKMQRYFKNPEWSLPVIKKLIVDPTGVTGVLRGS